jgi:hypothetical protein
MNLRRASESLRARQYLMILCGSCGRVDPRVSKSDTAGVITVYINPLSRSRVSRMAWSLFRHPMKSREFPAKNERLITADELLRYGV